MNTITNLSAVSHPLRGGGALFDYQLIDDPANDQLPASTIDSPPFPDLSGGEPANFPSAMLPSLLREITEKMARVYQTPICLPAMSALAVLAGATGRSVAVRGGYKDKATALNLYVIAVAERGSGKGNIGEILSEPIILRSHDLAEQYSEMNANGRTDLGVLKKEVSRMEQQAASTEGVERANLCETLSNRHKRIAELEAASTREVTLWVGDVTSEALGRALADNEETLFSYSSEAGAAIKVALGKYSDQGDFDLLLSGYSGDAVRVNRIGRKVVQLDSPCLSLLWLVQPCVVRQLTGDAEAFSRGLTARPLIFDTGAGREHDDRKNLAFTRGDAWAALTNKILDCRLSNAQRREIICSPEGREVFAKFHDESVDLERGQFADLAGELSRWRENAIKIAGLFAIVENVEVISAALADRAVAIVRWCGLNYLGLLQAGRRERLRSELERVLGLLRENDGEISLGTLVRNHGIKRAQLASLIAAFPAHLAIDRLAQQGAGRPAEVLRAATKSTISTK